MSAFGDLLAAIRAERGLSYPAMAATLGCAHSYIHSIEHGGRNPPKQIQQVEAWADALGLTGDLRERFVFLADLARAPESVQRQLLALEARLAMVEEAFQSVLTDDQKSRFQARAAESGVRYRTDDQGAGSGD